MPMTIISFLKKRYAFLLLIAIIALAAFMRLNRLSELPPGLYPDVAVNGLDAQDILNGTILPFYYRNGGREGMLLFLDAIAVFFLGNSALPLYLVSSLIGIITVYVLYRFGKMFFSERIGLISAFFLAVSFYHINFSRLGFRVILLPLFIMLSFMAFKKAYQNGRISDWIIAGAVSALGFYTYTAFRIVPLLWVAILLLIRRRVAWSQIRFKPFLISFTIVMLPLVLYAIRYPTDILSRTISASAAYAGSGGILHQLLGTLGMFFVRGDSLTLYNHTNAPLLGLWEAALFIVGFGIVIKTIKKPSSIMLLTLLVGTLLPVFLSEGVPHFLRGLGVVIPLYIIMAMAVDRLLSLKIEAKFRPLLLFGMGCLLATSMLNGYWRYFTLWSSQAGLKKEYYQDLVKISEYINAIPSDEEVTVLLGSMWLETKDPFAIVEPYLGRFPESWQPAIQKIAAYADPKRDNELNIDEDHRYFWEGNTVKYLVDSTRSYAVHDPSDITPNKRGIYIYSTLWHPEFREVILEKIPTAESIESNPYYEVFRVE